MNLRKIVLAVIMALPFYGLRAQQAKDTSAAGSATALLQRVLGEEARHFSVQIIPPEGHDDLFELESSGNRIILKGNNAVSVASALNYYLTHYAHCQITWNGTNLKLPDPLPAVTKTERHTSPYRYRYYLNYCTFNYTMSWWNWDRWQREIDWMALNGINMPLSLTGQDAIWRRVYKHLGLTDKDLENFFTGPAYFAWSWMGNLDGWGGPLPQSWSDNHESLQKQILQRERELGMTPILPAFSGHVPQALEKRYPDIKIRKTTWGTHPEELNILDPEDPLFLKIGSAFLEEQTRTFGTDHFYSADTFNENDPPSADSLYLDQISKKVYQSMATVDPSARWVMQGWLFYHSKEFWKPAQIKALLNAIPDDRMILLDLISEVSPVWNRTEAYYGKPWIWCMLHNFGGNTGMFGRLKTIASEPATVLHLPASGNLQGLGLTPEGIEQNPVVYHLMLENVWRREPVNLDQWLKQYTLCRYGQQNAYADSAWQVLKNTVYSETTNIRDCPESIVTGRPTFEKSTRWTTTDLHYRPQDLLPAWQLLIKASPVLRRSEGFNYDLADVTRQVLANYGNVLQQKFAQAYRDGNIGSFKKYSNDFLDLIADMDKVLATQKDFLLGTWLRDARNQATNEAEKALYERNARNLITLWGNKNSPLHEYACRQWSGLLNGFYRKRWEMFVSDVLLAMEAGKPFDDAVFEEKIRDWEWQWVNSRDSYPATTKGNTYEVANATFRKYFGRF